MDIGFWVWVRVWVWEAVGTVRWMTIGGPDEGGASGTDDEPEVEVEEEPAAASRAFVKASFSANNFCLSNSKFALSLSSICSSWLNCSSLLSSFFS